MSSAEIVYERWGCMWCGAEGPAASNEDAQQAGVRHAIEAGHNPREVCALRLFPGPPILVVGPPNSVAAIDFDASPDN
jgi:hypothetical protein